jgi:glutathione S-transferase
VAAKLYSLTLSHPSHAARLMLVRKRIEHQVVDLLPGMHPAQLRLAGFGGGTVPALKLDGRRIQGSLEISRTLEEIQPEPRLYPAAPDERRAVEEAERWAEAELQPVPRRIFRWATVDQPEVRRWMARDIVGMPAPGLMATLNAPIARLFRRKSRADDERVRADLAALPAMLDRVDALIADGTIGAEELNSADLQIGTTVRVLLEYGDLRPHLDGRPAAALATRVLPDYPGPIPVSLPSQWLAPLRG